MKKFFLSAIVFFLGLNLCALSAGSTPPVPTSADQIMQYKPQLTQPQQQPTRPAQPSEPKTTTSIPVRKLPLSIEALDSKLSKSIELINLKNFIKAEQTLDPLVKWLTDSTEYHILLLNTLKDQQDAQYQAEMERAYAIKSALLRDKAIYYYAIALMKQQKNEEAARNFILVVQSQPKSKLGFDSYQKLQELGFTQKIQFKHLDDVEK